MQQLLKVVLLLTTGTVLSGCPWDVKPDHETNMPSTDPIVARLIEKGFDTFEEPVKPENLAPNIKAYYTNPAGALGGVYILKAKPGKTCADSKPGELEADSLPPPSLPKGCKVNTSSELNLISKKIHGGTSAELKYFVGEAGASTDYAFEFFMSRPYSASFDNATSCVAVSEIMQMELPARTCEVRFIKGVMLTQLTYRTYVNDSTKTQNAFTALNLGGTAYYSVSDMITLPLLSVDSYTLEQFFARDDRGGGFLRRRRIGIADMHKLGVANLQAIGDVTKGKKEEKVKWDRAQGLEYLNAIQKGF